MLTIELARYRFFVDVTKPIELLDYAGSALRGAFGHALLRVCGLSTDDRDYQTPIFLQSPYVTVFAPQQPESGVSLNNLATPPAPYVIEAPFAKKQCWQVGEQFSFDMVVGGEALRHIEVIILAWRRAFLHGIGSTDGTGELTNVAFLPADSKLQVIYDTARKRVIRHPTALHSPEFSAPMDVHLRLQTPLRIQQKGKIAGTGELTASLFLRSLIRRVTTQQQMQQINVWPLERIRELNHIADKVADERRVAWQDWGRYSSRQKQVMKLGGVTGHWLFRQVPVELLPFLFLGQWLHVGKETVFGLGKYEWLTSS